jgi:hypothetical protein
MFRRILGVTVALSLCVAPVTWAQQTHVATNATLDQAVQQRVNQERADRAELHELLHQPAVRDAAAKAGLSIDQADAAVSTLQGRDLAAAASQARVVNAQLTGGANTIVISTTTIIIALLIVILILALK